MRRNSMRIMSQAVSLWFCALGFSPFGLARPQELRSVSPIPLPFHALHLRCGATDWKLSAASFLKPGPDSAERELSIDVKEPWMLTDGDSCILTETVEPFLWGAWQRQYVLDTVRLRAPSSAALIADAKASDHPFRVIFPKLGRYRAIYKVAEASLSFVADGVKAPGDVVWSWPGTASIDAAQRLYVELRDPAPSLVRVAPATGKAIWKYRAKERLNFNPECNDEERVLVLEQGALLALDSQTGLPRWHFDLRGELPDSTALLSCPSDSPLVFLIHGSQNREITALRRDSGQSLWTFKGTSYLNVQGSEQGVLYLSSFEDGISRVVGVDHGTGVALWTRYLNSSWFNFDPKGALYVLEGTQLSRLNAKTGQELWQYQSAADWIYLSFEQNRTLITEKDRVVRIDPDSGLEIWSQRLQQFFSQPSFASVLKSGEVLVRASDAVTQRERSLILDGANGEVLWESNGILTQSFVSLAPGTESYRLEGATVASLNIRTGETAWTYRYPLMQATGNREPQFVHVHPNGSKLFVSYTSSARPEPEMGVLALNRETGAQLWQNFQGEPLTIEGRAGGLLIVNVGTRGGVAKAIQL